MTRVGFTGYYGMGNYGDDLFGVLCNAAARQVWGLEATLVAPVIPGCDANYTVPGWYPQRLYGAGGVAGKASRLLSFARGLRASDVMVLGGGSVVNSRPASFRGPWMQALHRRGRLRLAAIGISIGPFVDRASEEAAASFLRAFDYIAVRDTRSHENARSLGLESTLFHGRDLAGLLATLELHPERLEPARHGERARLGVALCNYEDDGGGLDKDELLDELVAALGDLVRRRPLSVDLFSLNSHPKHGDEELSARARKRLGALGVESRVVLYRRQDPLELAREIGRCDAFFSVRLHGAIVAYMKGVPTAVVEYHPKCRDFADDVGIAPSLRVNAQRHGREVVSQTLAALLDEPPPLTVAPVEYGQRSHEMFVRSPWSRAGGTRNGSARREGTSTDAAEGSPR